MLTSISEALPLFVLEAFAAGVPVVATDVGCCRELIEGKGSDGDAAGAAGIVTAIASPQETARAVVELLRDPGAWAAARQAATAARSRAVWARPDAGGLPRHLPKRSSRKMAGIGFELRRLLDRQSLWGLVRAYAYAGVISSGPWVLSILGVMGIGLLSVGPVPAVEVRQFLVTITYLMAASLIWTGGLQLMFARFIADCIYRGGEGRVLPNLFGALTVTGGGAALLGIPLLFVLGGPPLVRLLTVVALIVLSASWIAVVLLSSLRDYRGVVLGFLLGYSLSVGGALLLRPLGLVGLLAGFLFGQVALLIAMVGLITRRFPSKALVSFEFLDRRRAYFTLAATGFLYNLGIWIDKLLFWFTPSTSEPVLGPLRASIIYDIPIFLAYLSIVPGWRCSSCASRPRSPSSTTASSPRSARASRSPTSAAGGIG